MKELFISINKDSYKNQWFINSDDFKQIKIIEFIKELNTYYKDFFAKKKKLIKVKYIQLKNSYKN